MVFVVGVLHQNSMIAVGLWTPPKAADWPVRHAAASSPSRLTRSLLSSPSSIVNPRLQCYLIPSSPLKQLRDHQQYRDDHQFHFAHATTIPGISRKHLPACYGASQKARTARRHQYHPCLQPHIITSKTTSTYSSEHYLFPTSSVKGQIREIIRQVPPQKLGNVTSHQPQHQITTQLQYVY